MAKKCAIRYTTAMKIWAIIPVKSLHKTKSRLANVLSPQQRAALTQQLLRQTLQILQQVAAIEQVVVVSRDETVAREATAHHARVVVEKDGDGLNEAVTIGKAYAANKGAQAVLVLPSDLPFIERTDIEALLAVRETAVSHQNTLIICSDQHQQGTNALLLPASLNFQFKYGHTSYQQHLTEANRHQLYIHTISIPSLQFDLDTERDWQQYQQKKQLIYDSE
ncbi:MAG: 2-phospho-L-lactate guanylyltransferase [Chloroflexi bacterium]|nr:2-phospho-L-lactate guanylyltransferase [Chloroflexota bacterium]